MVDVVSRATRSRMMSGIRGKNTAPELVIRSLLHRNGFRFSLHRKDLPGTPDIVMPSREIVVFVHGCFWHGHRCEIFKWPKTNAKFWREKISGNVARDRRSQSLLLQLGWEVVVFWECEVRRALRLGHLHLLLRRITKNVRGRD